MKESRCDPSKVKFTTALDWIVLAKRCEWIVRVEKKKPTFHKNYSQIIWQSCEKRWKKVRCEKSHKELTGSKDEADEDVENPNN
ncbi:hypothetical protein RUM43_002121, partial [Polyplax serrata]